eukprot:15094512-Alexandrium_andersonii.AAC.1
MSASLVGSEMCIRDRVLADLLPLPLAFRCCGGGVLRLCRAELRARRRGCLLYTSDAADDM